MNISDTSALEILERITDAFFSLDHEWKFTYINKEAARLLFCEKKDLVGLGIWSEFPEAVDMIFYKQYHKAVREQIRVNFDAYYPPLKTWFDVRAYPSPNGLSVYFQDITERKLLSFRREEHYKSLFTNNPDAVFSFDLEGNYLSVNPAMENLLGYSESELLGMSFTPLVTNDEINQTMENYSKAALGKTQIYETKAIHKHGHMVDVNVTNMPIIVNQEIVGVYGIARDISKEKQTETKLLESEKLSAVGQLAASIAHEIRNPLTSIKGFLQLMSSSDWNKENTYLKIMSDEITRIESITSELLVLAKPQAHEFKSGRIEKIIEDIVLLLGSQALMNKVEVKVRLDELPPILCVPNQIKQAFINLIKNAIEAMPDGGELSIKALHTDFNSIYIQISDQGKGIPQEFLSKIGSPFYTTKEKGTGLGMMTTLKIIESHGGTMNITSILNEGTSIDIVFPVENLANEQLIR